MYIIAKNTDNSRVILNLSEISKIKLNIDKVHELYFYIGAEYYVNNEMYYSLTSGSYEFTEDSLLSTIPDDFLEDYINGVFAMMLNDGRENPKLLLEPEISLFSYLDNDEIGHIVVDAMDLR